MRAFDIGAFLFLAVSAGASFSAHGGSLVVGAKVFNRVGTPTLPFSQCVGRVEKVIPVSRGQVAEIQFVLGPDGTPLPQPVFVNFNTNDLVISDRAFRSARALLEDALFQGVRPVEQWVDLTALAQIFARASRLAGAGLSAEAYAKLVNGKSRELADVRSELVQFVESTEIRDVSQLPPEAVPSAAVRSLVEQILLEHIAKRIEEESCGPVRNSMHLLALLSTESVTGNDFVYRPGIENPAATALLLSWTYGALKGSVSCLNIRRSTREYRAFVSRLSLEQLYTASARTLKQYYQVEGPRGQMVTVDADVYDHGARRMVPFDGSKIPADVVVYVWHLKKHPFRIGVKMHGIKGDSSDVRKLWAARN